MTMSEKPNPMVVREIHQIIRDHLPTSSGIADARMHDAATAIAARFKFAPVAEPVADPPGMMMRGLGYEENTD
jgi:hypothetical protein